MQRDYIQTGLMKRNGHTLIRTSCALGGATSTSSMESAFPGSQATAALHLIT